MAARSCARPTPFPKSWGSSTSRPTAFPTAAGSQSARIGRLRPAPGRPGGRPARPGRRIEPPGRRAVSLEEELRASHPGRRGDSRSSSRSRSRSTPPRPRSPGRRSPPGPRSSTTSARSAAIPRWRVVAADTAPASSSCTCKAPPPPCRPTPLTHDVVAEVYDFLARRVEWAERRGIPRERSPSTPASASARRSSTTSRYCGTSSVLPPWDVPILIGLSRKGFLGSITGRPVSERTAATVGRLARRLPSWCPDRPRARRRRDGRRHPRLDRLEGWEIRT